MLSVFLSLLFSHLTFTVWAVLWCSARWHMHIMSVQPTDLWSFKNMSACNLWKSGNPSTLLAFPNFLWSKGTDMLFPLRPVSGELLKFIPSFTHFYLVGIGPALQWNSALLKSYLLYFPTIEFCTVKKLFIIFPCYGTVKHCYVLLWRGTLVINMYVCVSTLYCGIVVGHSLNTLKHAWTHCTF